MTTEIDNKDIDWEMAEVKCSCGWYGSADSLNQYRPKGENTVHFHCPLCGGKLWEDEEVNKMTTDINKQYNEMVEIMRRAKAMLCPKCGEVGEFKDDEEDPRCLKHGTYTHKSYLNELQRVIWG